MIAAASMIAAVYMDGRSARLREVKLAVGGGMIAVTGGNVVRAYAYGEAQLGEPYANAPCIVRFSDGARCEVADPYAKAMLASALCYRPSALVRLRAHWYDLLLVLGLTGGMALALLRQA